MLFTNVVPHCKAKNGGSKKAHIHFMEGCLCPVTLAVTGTRVVMT